MPCDCSYMNPSGREEELYETANLLLFAYQQLGREIDEDLEIDAYDVYAANEARVPELCALLNSLTEEEMERVVYNARNRKSRDLADWWEEHQEADRERERKGERK